MTAIEIIALIVLLISLVMLILSFAISMLFNDDPLFLLLVYVIGLLVSVSFCLLVIVTLIEVRWWLYVSSKRFIKQSYQNY